MVRLPDAGDALHDNDFDAQLDDYTLDMKGNLDAIRNASLPPDADSPPLTEKQVERFEAFQMRIDR